MSRIEGRTVLITGGASGIGYSLGRQLLTRGAKTLVIWDIREPALNAAVHQFRASGYDARGFAVDVADLARVRLVLDEMHKQSLHVDVLVNNAGVVVGKTFADHSDDDITRTMSINALAPMHLTRAVLPGMQERGAGHIVNIASAAGMLSNPRMSVYCASKWATIGWSDSLRIELERARSRIKVTTVTPYYTDTGMFAGVRSRLIPIVKTSHLASRIVAAIEHDQIFVRTPRILHLLPLVRGLLPARWFDRIIGDWLGVYESMRSFTGRP